MKPKFIPGKNIAIKTPSHEFNRTVAFYRDILGLEEISLTSPDAIESVTFNFGDKNLWIDRIDGISQAETWFEILTDDLELAANYFKTENCIRRDEIEPLPKGFKGFWISSPSNIIHLISESDSPIS